MGNAMAWTKKENGNLNRKNNVILSKVFFKKPLLNQGGFFCLYFLKYEFR